MKDGRITIMFPVNYLGAGGTEQQLLELVKAIDKSRFKPLVVSLYPGGPLEPEVKRIHGAELVSVNRKGKYDFWTMMKMYSLLKRKKVDIIQPFLTPATFFGLLPAVISHTPVKIVTERSGAGLTNHLGHKVYQRIEDFLTRFAEWVIPNSETGRRFLIDRGINPARIKVIYNGINLERLTPDAKKVDQIRNKIKLPPDGKVVGIIASLTPTKDHVTFLRGAKIINQAIPRTRFAIVGDGILRQKLENLTDELGIKSLVTFFGHQEDVASYISSFDIACLCSRAVEGCSNAILEAMALGKPVVASDLGGNREVIEHNKTGLLIPDHSPEALADAVFTLLSEFDRAQEMGQRARVAVLDRFSLVHMVSEYEKLYEKTIKL